MSVLLSVTRESENRKNMTVRLTIKRKRRVYCTIDDMVSSIRDSGLVGTCYDSEMAVENDPRPNSKSNYK